MNNNVLTVGIGEIKFTKEPGEVLVAYGLGSCLGIGAYDPQTKMAGMLHAMLPNFSRPEDHLSAKFVDSGIKHLVEKFEEEGVSKGRLVIKVAGGANMLNAPGLKDTFNIGERNLTSSQEEFKKLNLKYSAEEVGGHTGRTVRLYVSDGRMTIRTMGNQEREI